MRTAFALAILTCVSGVGVLAQNAETLDFHELRKERKLSTEEMVKAFEAPPIEVYTLRQGDEIFVEVWTRPELSGKHIIGPDGRITLPVVGSITLANLTREGAQDAVRTALLRYYSEIAVTIRVDRYTSYHIYVLGRVTTGGALEFEKQPNLLQVLTRAGSLPVGGSGAEKAGLVRCAIFRGTDKIVWIDLRPLVSQGNLALNIRLAPDDLVYLPDADDRLVYVLGDVAHPGAYRLTADMSFLDAYSQAGGATDDGDQAHIAHIRSGIGQREISMKQILAGKKDLNMAMEEGDIIFVPKKGLAKCAYVLQKAAPITGFAILYSTVK